MTRVPAHRVLENMMHAALTKLRRNRSVSRGIVILGGICLWAFIWGGQRESVPLSMLLASNPAFPTHWETGELPVGSIDWAIAETSDASEPQFYADAERDRIWTHKGEKSTNLYIQQRVLKYTTAGRATLQWYLSHPERAYARTVPGFRRPHTDTWTYTSTSADRQFVVCGMGPTDSCQLWFYWVQYGQYIGQIVIFAPNQGIDEKGFAQIGEQLDSSTSDVLTLHGTRP